jgi:hypothetical protein
MGTFVCFPDAKPETSENVYYVCKVISAVCLGVTLLIYLFIPLVRSFKFSIVRRKLVKTKNWDLFNFQSLNIHEKALICYVACLFIAFILLALQWNKLNNLDDLGCAVFGENSYWDVKT